MKKAVIALVLGVISFTGYSQKTVKGWSEMEDKKFFKKMIPGTGSGNIKKFINRDDIDNSEQIPKLEKIGILGLSIFQPTFSDKEPYSIITPYLTDAGSVFFSDMLYKDAVSLMKNAYAANGATLLTPDEYLDTEEEKKRYAEAQFEPSKLMAAVASISNRIRGGQADDVRAGLPGYKYLVGLEADAKMWREIGKFAAEIGLDAVLVIETQLGYDGKNLGLQKIRTFLVGPNPIPYRESDEKHYAPFGPLKGHLEGIVYGSLIGISPSGGQLLATLKKGSIKDSYFEGMDKVYARIAEELLKHSKAELEKLKD